VTIRDVTTRDARRRKFAELAKRYHGKIPKGTRF